MQLAEIRTIVEHAATAWIQGDAGAFAALFTSNGEFIVPGTRWLGQTAIHQAVTDFAATAADVSINITQILVGTDALQPNNVTDNVDHAFVEWHWENTDTATGQWHQADDAIAIDFQHGRISRWREYIDTQTRSE